MVRTSRPKGLRDIRQIPPDPWTTDEHGSRSRLPLLLPDAPIGSYLLDNVVVDMLRDGAIKGDRTELEVVADARALADTAGAWSVLYARAELTASSRHKDAENFIETLSMIRDRARVACGANTHEIAGSLSRDTHEDVEDGEAAEDEYWDTVAVFDELLSDLAMVANKIDHRLREYRLQQHRPSSAEPLTNYFMRYCALFWARFTGQSLDKKDRSDFRRFLVAAWQDLRFPDPTEPSGTKKPVEDHIRERLAKSDIFDQITL